MKRPTRALSIRQPYAEQILSGSKRIEYRKTPTRILDEPVYIYASLTPEAGGEDLPRGGLTAASLARLSAPDPSPTVFTRHARFALNALPALRSDQASQLGGAPPRRVPSSGTGGK